MASQTSESDVGSSGQETGPELRSSDLPSRRLLGKGLCGIVYETTWNGERYARKDFVEVPKEIFREEASVLFGLQEHKNIVKTYGWTVDNRSCSLVLEYMEDDLLSLLQKRKESKRSQAGKGSENLSEASRLIESSLHKFITERKKSVIPDTSPPPLELQEALDVMLQISMGMAYLHEQKIAHGDLKPRNVLVTYSNEGVESMKVESVKVADFGLIQTKSKSMFFVSRWARKLDMAQWKAPEYLDMLFGHKLSTMLGHELHDESDSDEDEDTASRLSGYDWLCRADVYSYAVTCFQILTGEVPYPNLKLMDKILFQRPGPKLPAAFQSKLLNDLLESCWGDPAQRPTFSAICNKLKGIIQLEKTASSPNTAEPDTPVSLQKQIESKPVIHTLQEIQLSKMDVTASSSRKPVERLVSDSRLQDPVINEIGSFETEIETEIQPDIQRPHPSMQSEMETADSPSQKPVESSRSPDLVPDKGIFRQEEYSVSSLVERKKERWKMLNQREKDHEGDGDYESSDRHVDNYANRGPENTTTRKRWKEIFVGIPSKIQDWSVNKTFWKPRGIRLHHHLSRNSLAADFKALHNSLIEDPMSEYFTLSGFPYGVSTDSLIGQQVIVVLAQGSRGSLPEAELDLHGRVIKLRSAQPFESPVVTDSPDRSKFMRLPIEFSDLKGQELQFLSDLCHAAHRSEEFFLSVATDQWVQTTIICDRTPQELFSLLLIEDERGIISDIISDFIIHSNVLPCDPFLPKLSTVRHHGASKSVQFPCSILKEALQEGKTLKTKLLEWRESGGECGIGQHGLKRSVDGNTKEGPLRLLWDIPTVEVKKLKMLSEGSGAIISLVTWRGGLFARKERISTNSYARDDFERELSALKTLSHPNIIYCFGVDSYGASTGSLFMEYMPSDLSCFIMDSVHITGGNEPPFSHHDSVDILLQVAKAMAHMHDENVIHGDLKPSKILISEFLTSEDVKRYLVKVAGFASAQLVSSHSAYADFRPDPATTIYASPEVLKSRHTIEFIPFPERIDVYSFGIVAFEVLSGKTPYTKYRSQSEVKKGIIEGTMRPPLRAECQKDNFLHDERLISLIESCWHGDPSKRPSFSKIVEVLNNSVRVQVQILV